MLEDEDRKIRFLYVESPASERGKLEDKTKACIHSRSNVRLQVNSTYT